jgi:sulfur-oxidizing protein SoxY
MRRTAVATFVVWSSLLAAGLSGSVGADDFDTPQWTETRQALFQSRPIQADGSGIVQLEVPLRPDDAAAVPVLIKIKSSKPPEQTVKNLYVVIDRNPEPVAGVFHLGPASGGAEIQARLRVETHSPMRVIAETSDGKLYMSAKLVKAAGGCAAPPVMITAPPNLGQIQLRAQDKPTLNEPNRAQLIVVHPNHTGFQRHPLTALPITSHYVKDVTVTFDNKPVLAAETTIAMSEDPDVRFYFTPTGPGILKVEVKDSRGQGWSKSMEMAPK